MKVRFKKITIVAERVLHEQIVDLLKRHKVSGWTVQNVTGEGSRGLRASEWEGSNVQVYTLVPQAVADAIMEEIAQHFFEHWSVVVYSQDVEVLRPGKYQEP
jgi:nitrogen regulatory protein P-II 2